jgi:hypothetical protein
MQGSDIKVGDLVRARHWKDGEMAIVLEKRPRGAIVRLKIFTSHNMWEIDQLAHDLEVINENR